MYDSDRTPNLPIPREAVDGYRRAEAGTRGRLTARIQQLRNMAGRVMDTPVMGPRGHCMTINEAKHRADWIAEQIDLDEMRGSHRHRRVSRTAKLLSLVFVVIVDFPIMLWLASSVFNVDWTQPLGLPLVISVVITVLATGGAATSLHHLGHNQRENKDDQRQLKWSAMSRGSKVSLAAATVLVVLIGVVMFVRVYSEGVLSGLESLAALLAVLVAFVMLIAAGLVFWTAFRDGSLEQDDLECYSMMVLHYEQLKREFEEEAEHLNVQFERLRYTSEDQRT
jgi:hypothetical protein